MAKPITLGGTASPQDILDVSTTPYHVLGEIAFLLDGREFHYAKHEGSATLSRGVMLFAEDAVADHQALATNGSALSIGRTSVPSGTVTLGATALTADQYAGGYFVVSASTGAGTMYRIVRHDAGTASGTDFTVELDEAISVADGASTEVSFVQNLYKNPQQPTAYDEGRIPIGMACVSVPDGSTNAQYFWMQTRGPNYLYYIDL